MEIGNIKFLGFFKPIKTQSKKADNTRNEKQGEKRPQNYTPAQLSAAVLANVTYKNNPKEAEQELKRIIKENENYFRALPEDFYEKFDYENADRHLSHLQFLVDIDSDMGNGWVFKNGYFYSKDGADAFDILMNNYSTKNSDNYRAAFNIMLGWDSQTILAAEKRGLFDNNLIKTDDEKFDKIIELMRLSDEEFDRLKASGLMEKDIYYASDNDDINKMFVLLKSKGNKDPKLSNHILKTLDKLISAEGNADKIKEITGKISEIEHKDVLIEFISKYEDRTDIEFLANNLDNIYNLIHSNIRNFDDNSFFSGIEDVLYIINNDNLETSKKLILLKGMTQVLLKNVISYMYNEKNIQNVQSIIEDINAGKEELIALPAYKYAQINPRVAAAKGAELKEYDADASLSKLEEESKTGDIFAHGDNVYIKNEDKLEKLDLDKNTYKKLFPEYQSLCIQQGEDTGDCYFLSGGLISFWKNPKGRVHLLKMFKQDGNDIVVTIPELKKYPVRFKNGKIELLHKHAKTSLGNLMLEQAYAKARYANEQKIPGDPSKINADKAMEYIYGGYESYVFNELTGTNNAIAYIERSYDLSLEKPERYEYITKKDMSEIFDKYSDLNKYMVCMGSGCREDGNLPSYGVTPKHAYAVENIDTENKTVTIINPYNSLYTSTISYEQAQKYFSNISVIEV